MEDWRKSSYSGANGGSCVETSSGAGVILVIDTTNRDGFTLSVPAEAWAKFTATIKLARHGMTMAGTGELPRARYRFCATIGAVGGVGDRSATTSTPR
jgi:hypothetical protein